MTIERLIELLKNGSTKVVIDLLVNLPIAERITLINSTSANGQTPLMAALQRPINSAEIVKQLLAFDANPHQLSTVDGKTQKLSPWLYVNKIGKEETSQSRQLIHKYRTLIAAAINSHPQAPNMTHNDDLKCQHITQQQEITATLSESKISTSADLSTISQVQNISISPPAINFFQQNYLRNTIKKGDSAFTVDDLVSAIKNPFRDRLTLIEAILKNNSTLINKTSNSGHTPLMAEVLRKHTYDDYLSVITLLLAYGADPRYTSEVTNKIAQTSPEEYVAKKCTDRNLQNIYQEYHELFIDFIENHPNVSENAQVKDIDNLPLLSPDQFVTLIKCNGRLPLIAAAIQADIMLVNKASDSGETPLMAALLRNEKLGNLEVIRLLTVCGANPLIPSYVDGNIVKINPYRFIQQTCSRLSNSKFDTNRSKKYQEYLCIFEKTIKNSSTTIFEQPNILPAIESSSLFSNEPEQNQHINFNNAKIDSITESMNAGDVHFTNNLIVHGSEKKNNHSLSAVAKNTAYTSDSFIRTIKNPKKENHLEHIEDILKNNSALINQASSKGETPLMAELLKEHDADNYSVLILLLQYGADPRCESTLSTEEKTSTIDYVMKCDSTKNIPAITSKNYIKMFKHFIKQKLDIPGDKNQISHLHHKAHCI